MAQFSVPLGTHDYFRGYKEPEGEAAYFLLTGDLCQMGTMEELLTRAGFPVARSQSGTYPGFKKADEAEYLRALKHLFNCRIDGWWNQPLVERGICTQAEFDEALQKQT